MQWESFRSAAGGLSQERVDLGHNYRPQSEVVSYFGLDRGKTVQLYSEFIVLYREEEFVADMPDMKNMGFHSLSMVKLEN